MNSEHCIFCGAEIPEGRQVCYECEKKEDDSGNGTETYNLEQLQS